MNKADKWLFLGYLLLVVACLGGITLAKGGFYIHTHEGDVLHLVDILFRIELGQLPHIDFMTPLGIMAFLPINAFLATGFGVGTAILLSQIAVALCMVPMLWWLGVSRLNKPLAYCAGSLVLIMVLALIYGNSKTGTSMSMYYNRWAWGFAFIAVLIATLKPVERKSALFDGVIIGLTMAFFILAKATYAVGFAPGLLVALMLRKQWTTMALASSLVLLLLALVTTIFGLEFWQAYIGDLLTVRENSARPQAGMELVPLLASPATLLGTISAFAAVILLRKSDDPDLGTILMVLAPGCFYVTYQNFGNDPKWLALIALLIFATPSTPHLRNLALAMAVMISPSFFNMAYSPLHHYQLSNSAFEPVFDDARHADFKTPTGRVETVKYGARRIFNAPELVNLSPDTEEREIYTFAGEQLEQCNYTLGVLGVIQAVAKSLDQRNWPAGTSIFAADVLNSYWMFSDLAPTANGAPWYYGGLSGLDNADYLLIPVCTSSSKEYLAMLEELNALDPSRFRKIDQTELYRLYEIN